MPNSYLNATCLFGYCATKSGSQINEMAWVVTVGAGKTGTREGKICQFNDYINICSLNIYLLPNHVCFVVNYCLANCGPRWSVTHKRRYTG